MSLTVNVKYHLFFLEKIHLEQMQAILLAAGFGTRLKPYTLIKPKPLFTVVNQPLLEVGLNMLKKAGCERVVVNCHHLADQVLEAVASYPEVITQYEPEILGTGGSLREALHHLTPGPLLVMNGDIYHDIDLGALYRFHQENQCQVTMAVHDYPRFNTLSVDQGNVTAFNKLKNRVHKAFTGVHVVDQEVLQMIPETGFFHIIDLYKELAVQGEIAAYEVDGCFWRDMGTPDDYLKLHRELLTEASGVEKWDIAPTATLHQGVHLEGWGTVGQNAVIGAGAKLTNAVVWDNAVIAPGSIVKDAIITDRDLT